MSETVILELASISRESTYSVLLVTTIVPDIKRLPEVLTISEPTLVLLILLSIRRISPPFACAIVCILPVTCRSVSRMLEI